MEDYIFYILEFFVSFILIFLYYRILVVKKEEKLLKKKMPPELNLFIKLNRIDVKKVSYSKLLKQLSWINALVVASTLLIVEVTGKIYLKLLLAIPVGAILMYGLYKLLGVYYKKKGMIMVCTTIKK